MRDLIDHMESDLNWYVILNETSDGQPQRCFYDNGGSGTQGLWLNTPYAKWHEVMPTIASISPDHPFLDWIEGESCDDWGVLVGSYADFLTVQAHFRSLTHVWLPSSEHVFFRFYDPRFGIDVARFCDDEQRTALMGPTQCWLSVTAQDDLTRVDNPAPITQDNFQERAFPWWTVPEAVLAELSKQDKSTLIANSLKWLKEQHADIYFYFPEPILNAKVTHLVNRYNKTTSVSLNQYLHQSLHQEVYR
ncbi:DUF4123 domain-containing protein [Marinomonas sp.]|uniref:DUF4123 domain-containing protein n=1 Tax=Marinomonas sp. TaxID=1904862 RepID=UPI003BA8EAEA